MRTSARVSAQLLLAFITLCTGCDDPGGGTQSLTSQAAASPSGATASAVALAAPSAPSVKIAQPTKLTAIHQHGQTFLSWDEVEGVKGVRYQVYRLHRPITAQTLSEATLLGEVGQGSARFYAARTKKDGGWGWRYGERLPGPDGVRLPEGRGMLVWTIDTADPTPGYYAVISANRRGANRSDLGPGNSIGPIEESKAEPMPVEMTEVDVGPQGHLMVQFMDLRHYNPTFHAPGEHNKHLGLPKGDPGRDHALAYAYDYTVYEPAPGKCPKSGKIPVMIKPHGWGGNRYKTFQKNPDPWWCAYMIFPVDESQTWHFGFAEKTDYRKGKAPQPGDSVVNYTEARLIRMIHDLQRHPTFGPTIDPERIYVFGHSMGGSGALAMATRYPDLFAAAYAASPMANYRLSGSTGGANWVNDVAPKWGSPEHNLPIKLQLVGGYGAHLKKYEGTGVWDWQNHVEQLETRMADPMAPISVLHGTADRQVEWDSQAVHLLPALNKAKRWWSAAATDGGHNWQGFRGLGGPFRAPKGAPFLELRAVKSETVPGLSHVSLNPSLTPPVQGLYNHQILWSASWDAWDGAPVDEAERWRVSLCTTDPAQNRCGTGEAAKVDVTPRRLQRFQVKPGGEYAWQLKAVKTNNLLGSGKVTASAEGLITVPQVEIPTDGIRLELLPIKAP